MLLRASCAWSPCAGGRLLACEEHAETFAQGGCAEREAMRSMRQCLGSSIKRVAGRRFICAGLSRPMPIGRVVLSIPRVDFVNP